MFSIRNLFGLLVSDRKPLNEVFTPNSAAGISYVSRKDLETMVESNLSMIGRPIILYGHSGSGKTTLIRNLFKRLKLNPVITSCESSSTFESVLLAAFDQLNTFYVAGFKNTNSVKISTELRGEFKFLSGVLKEERQSVVENQHKRLLSPQLTPQRLAKLLGAINGVWVIEDFHKVKEVEKQRIADVIKIFIDESNVSTQLLFRHSNI